MKRILALLFAILCALALLTGCVRPASPTGSGDPAALTDPAIAEEDRGGSVPSLSPGTAPVTAEPSSEEKPDEHGTYTSRDEVALFLATYGRLPDNFITKKEAQALGWPGGELEPYAPGKCIGGDYFGNYEKRLPTDKKYRECDVDTLGKKSRGAKRLIYTDDGWIYYTDDHYESFTLLYRNGAAV